MLGWFPCKLLCRDFSLHWESVISSAAMGLRLRLPGAASFLVTRSSCHQLFPRARSWGHPTRLCTPTPKVVHCPPHTRLCTSHQEQKAQAPSRVRSFLKIRDPLLPKPVSPFLLVIFPCKISQCGGLNENGPLSSCIWTAAVGGTVWRDDGTFRIGSIDGRSVSRGGGGQAVRF